MDRTRFALSLTLLGACLAVVPLSAQEVAYEKYVLPNGLTVILHEDHSVPLAAVNFWYYVGSKDEAERRSGFAHMFEHLMFMGTDRVPGGDIDKIMEVGGGSGNASTSRDRTNYYAVGPPELLPTLLWLDADRLQDLGRMMNQEKLDKQRAIVRNERRENYENHPYGRADIAVFKVMFPKNHPYHHHTIGSHEDLEAATVGDVKNFFAKFYVPSNASLVVAGDFDPEEIKPMIANWFGKLPGGSDILRPPVERAELEEVIRLTMTDNVQNSRTEFVYHSSAYLAEGDAATGLAAGILSDGISSRLYDRLVTRDKLALEVRAYQGSMMLGSLFHVRATARQGVNLDDLEAAMDEVIGAFLRDGPTEKELEKQAASDRLTLHRQLVNSVVEMVRAPTLKWELSTVVPDGLTNET